MLKKLFGRSKRDPKDFKSELLEIQKQQSNHYKPHEGNHKLVEEVKQPMVKLKPEVRKSIAELKKIANAQALKQLEDEVAQMQQKRITFCDNTKKVGYDNVVYVQQYPQLILEELGIAPYVKIQMYHEMDSPAYRIRLIDLKTNAYIDSKIDQVDLIDQEKMFLTLKWNISAMYTNLMRKSDQVKEGWLGY